MALAVVEPLSIKRGLAKSTTHLPDIMAAPIWDCLFMEGMCSSIKEGELWYIPMLLLPGVDFPISAGMDTVLLPLTFFRQDSWSDWYK